MGAAGSASAPAGKAEHSGLVDEKGALQSTPVPLAKVIYALHLPRLLAAIHIVLGHFTPRPNLYVGGVMDWSVWWVDFFFILSGFGAAHGRYHASSVKAVAEEGPIVPSTSLLLKRAVSIYPTYLLAFLMAWVARCYLMSGCTNGQSCYRAPQLILEGLGLHSWFPVSMRFIDYSYNKPSWFVSSLALCWFFERAFIRLAANLQLYAGKGNVPWAAGFSLALYIVASPTAAFPFTWQRCGIEVWAWRALHIYFSGAALAAYLHSRAEAGHGPFRFAATLAALFLVVLFLVPSGLDRQGPSVPNITQLAHAGLSLPPMLLLVAGLAGGADVLARVGNSLPLVVNDLARDLAGPIYLLQQPVALCLAPVMTSATYPATWCANWPFGSGFHRVEHVIFLATLVAVSAVVHFGVQKPIAAWCVAKLGF